MITSVVAIALCACAVALTGVLLSVARQPRIPLAEPLLIYPVTQHVPGACAPGTPGITGPEPSCYQVAEGLVVRTVSAVDVEPLPDGTYGISLHLVGADRSAFANLTRARSGGQLALVVNGQVVTAPRVDAPVTGGRILVTGQFSQANADKLAYDLTGK